MPLPVAHSWPCTAAGAACVRRSDGLRIGERRKKVGAGYVPQGSSRFLIQPGFAYRDGVEPFDEYRHRMARTMAEAREIVRTSKRLQLESRRLAAALDGAGATLREAIKHCDEVLTGLGLLERRRRP
jgi:hypothetical protein